MVVDKSSNDLYKVLKCANGIYKEEDNNQVINRLLPEFSKEINYLIDEVMENKDE